MAPLGGKSQCKHPWFILHQVSLKEPRGRGKVCDFAACTKTGSLQLLASTGRQSASHANVYEESEENILSSPPHLFPQTFLGAHLPPYGRLGRTRCPFFFFTVFYRKVTLSLCANSVGWLAAPINCSPNRSHHLFLASFPTTSTCPWEALPSLHSYGP